MPRTVLAGLIGAVGGAALMLFSLPSELFGRDPPARGIVVADPAEVAVVDGGTLRLRSQVIRLAGIAAPPRGTACRGATGGQYDCGVAASDALAGLVRGREVRCRIDGRDATGRLQGWCEAAGSGLSQSLVAAGWARGEADDLARAAGRGFWQGGTAPVF